MKPLNKTSGASVCLKTGSSSDVLGLQFSKNLIWCYHAILSDQCHFREFLQLSSRGMVEIKLEVLNLYQLARDPQTGKI